MPSDAPSRLRPAMALRIAFGVVTLACVSWLSWHGYLYVAESRTIAALEKEGALFDVNDAGSPQGAVQDFARGWRYVTMTVEATPVDLRLACKLRGLHTLHFQDTALREEDVQAFSKMSQLQRISMMQARAPRSTWRQIAHLRNLTWLLLKDVDVGDDGVEELTALRQLRWLDLSHCGVTDKGLTSLGALADLDQLELARSGISAVGLRQLATLPRLTRLDLSKCGLADAALESLVGCKSLWQLDLSGNPITDASLKTLCRMKNLMAVRLRGTNVSDTRLESFIRTDGHCTIVHNPSATESN